jgi:hypothetical protein
MAKKPRTRQGMALRRGDPAAFNPANGEPHVRRFLESAQHRTIHKGRRFTYATAERRERDGEK